MSLRSATTRRTIQSSPSNRMMTSKTTMATWQVATRMQLTTILKRMMTSIMPLPMTRLAMKSHCQVVAIIIITTTV